MSKSEHNHRSRDNRDSDLRPNDELDREIDAVLSRYAAVEPRCGLEDRVLAKIKAERELTTAHTWWHWPRVAACVAAVVMVVAASLVWRLWKPSQEQDVVAHHPSYEIQSNQMHSSQMQSSQMQSNQMQSNQAEEGRRPATGPNTDSERVRRRVPAPRNRKRDRDSRVPVVAADPRLEQFPSPQPLSDQEKILMSYVTEYPEHATLIAQARAEVLRREAAEESVTGKNDDRNSQQ